MRSPSLLASLAVLASTALAFENTFPIVAWSDVETASLATLSPSHPSHARAVFRPSSQTPFPAPLVDRSLCTLQTILLISAPGLHSSDLSLLPAHSAIRAASAASADSLTVPYVPAAKNSETAAALAKRFVSECEAVVQKKGLATGSSGRAVRVEVVDGLREWELTGSKARSMRRAIVERIDALVGEHLESLPAGHLVVLTSLPSLAAHDQARLAKRQFVESDELSYDADEFASGEPTAGEYTSDADDDDDYAYFSPIESAAAPAFAPNQTSVFQPRPNGGLLSRYVFFTAPLILCLLISIFILIPLLVFSTAALTSTETVAGLESKMTGTVGLDPSKA